VLVAIVSVHTTHLLKLLVCALLSVVFKASGQAPIELTSYLKSNQVSKSAKDVYNTHFKAGDDNKTASILDSLNTRNNATRPFYIYLVSKLMEQSDAALSEQLGYVGKEFIEHNPDNLIDFLYSKQNIVSKKFISLWAKQIAGEFMIDCEGKEQQCVNKSLQGVLTKTKAENKTKIKQFYDQIRSYCH
jgi:hypothetical protein